MFSLLFVHLLWVVMGNVEVLAALTTQSMDWEVSDDMDDDDTLFVVWGSANQ